jgi:hypothetical protein
VVPAKTPAGVSFVAPPASNKPVFRDLHQIGVPASRIKRLVCENLLYRRSGMTHIASDAYSSQLAENALGRGVSP